MASIAQRLSRISFKVFRKVSGALNMDAMKWHNTYLQYIPDRYSILIDKYRSGTNFLSFSDLKFWNKNNHTNNVCDITRFIFLNLCIDSLLEEGIKGDVAELGVYKGNSAYLLSKFAKRANAKFYLFDTFSGFDANDITGVDSNVVKETFTDTSLEGVKSLVGDSPNDIYVQGYFPESLSKVNNVGSFSLVHIDCDLEKPFIASLNYFYPKMVKGGFLIMHDYSSLQWPGAKVAVDDFFKDKPEFVIPVPDKSGTCVIRKV